MKKQIVALLISSLMISSLPVSAFAATENHVTKDIVVASGHKFTTSDAPSLVIAASEDHTENFKFSVALDNAEWKMEGQAFPDGITYENFTNNTLIFNVDISKFDAKNKDIRIPLLCELDAGGDAYVSVDGLDSTVSSGKYRFAKGISGNLEVTASTYTSIGVEQKIREIKIEDNTSLTYHTDDVITLELSNGFVFANNVAVLGSGKYDGVVNFEKDSNDNSKAKIRVVNTTKGGIGKILINDLLIQSTKTSQTGPVEISVKLGNDKVKVKLGFYSKEPVSTNSITELQVETNTDKPLIMGKGEPNRSIVAFIDGVNAGKSTVDKEGNFTIDFKSTGRKGLEEGEHNIVVGYYLNDINKRTYEVKSTFTTTYKEAVNTVSLSIGAYGYTVSTELNSQVTEKGYGLDAPAFIDNNGRTMLPLRGVANAIGILDANIVWDSKNQTVTISKDTNRVMLKVGEKSINVNGAKFDMDTNAVNVSDRVFVPLRPLLNALGIKDENIKWNESAKKVIFNY